MCSRVEYYNPENDLALAAGYENYTAPMAARRLRQAGAMLPMWYAQPGDRVLSFGVNAQWWDECVERFGIDVDIWDHECGPGLRPSPWGWSLAVRRYFSELGFHEDVLPSEAAIAKIRELSHRRTASMLAKRLAQDITGVKFTDPAVECQSVEMVGQIIAERGSDVMIKFPWSSSGRGLANSRLMGKEKTLRMASESISKQGSVMVEPAHERALDFALLYECRDGDCVWVGTSVFDTDSRGIYMGNMLASEQMRRETVGKYYDINVIDQVREVLRALLAQEIAPYYNGVLGMDMLITKEGMLDPAVELNLRKTMGWVANRFADRYLADGAEGKLRVIPGRAKAGPVRVENKKLMSGMLNLTPDNPYFTFQASI